MKKILIALGIFITLSFGYSSYCNGFKQGYQAGYCYEKNFCSAPVTPLCPLPILGKDTWKDGYSRGFLIGLANRR